MRRAVSGGLDSLLRLRKLQADQARAELGEALRAEAAAGAALAAARSAPGVEGGKLDEDAGCGGAGVLAIAFANWLPAAAAAIARHGLAAQAAASIRQQASEEAAARKGAREAVELLMDRRLQAERRRILRKVQVELDALGTRARRDGSAQ